MLKQVQIEKLESAHRRQPEKTLPSTGKAADAARSERDLAVRDLPTRRSRSSVGALLQLLVVLLWGGALVGAGALASWWLTRRDERASVTWAIRADGAKVTINGQPQANQGAAQFDCATAVELIVELPNRAAEAHRVPCGTELVLRVELPPGR